MRCAHCGRIIYSRKNYLGVKVWEHQSDGCRSCDPSAKNSETAEPNWAELIDGFGRKMDELAKSNVGRTR